MTTPTTFWVVCTDKTTHPSRELAKLKWYGEHNDPQIWEPMIQQAIGHMSLEDIEAVRGWDSVGVTGSRSARRGGKVACSDVVEREVVHREGPLWRFRCPTCRRDVPLSDKNLRQVVAKFVDSGMSRLDVSHLR